MPLVLYDVLEGLGLTQYLGTLREHGFDSWETVLDITEADMEFMGVKLGHRRKIQRRIAHSRGIPTTTALPVPTQNNSQEISSLESEQLSTSREDGPGEACATKRRYRRHPKPDKNAPERPPSAYVLFSNETRDELKAQPLSFTEIAKIVGKNWQRASTKKRELFQAEAGQAKETYRQELAQYKRTPEYDQYLEYLKDFKKKQQSPRRAIPDLSRTSTSGLGKSRRTIASNGVNSSSGAETNGPYQKIETSSPTSQRGREQISALGGIRGTQEQHTESSGTSESPREISQMSPFGARNVPDAVRSGPHRHQKLPSLSDVLKSRAESGEPTMSPQRTSWASCSLSERPALTHEQPISSTSPRSTTPGYALSGPGTDALSINSGNHAQSVYQTASPMQGQPLLAYGVSR